MLKAMKNSEIPDKKEQTQLCSMFMTRRERFRCLKKYLYQCNTSSGIEEKLQQFIAVKLGSFLKDAKLLLFLIARCFLTINCLKNLMNQCR